MTKIELLHNNYEMACHNLLCYSANYLMSEPKAGFDKEWKKSAKECELLKEMMNELPHGWDNNLEFIGIISSFSVEMNPIHKEQYISSLIVSDREDNYRMFNIKYEAGKSLLKSYDIERHNRYDIDKDTNIVFTVNNFTQMIESWKWMIE